MKVIKPCIKHYHDAEEALCKSGAWSKKKFAARKKMRTLKGGTRSSAISGLRAPEAATEFIRLRDRYLNSTEIPEPPVLAELGVTLRDLAVEVETSFDGAGESHEWPEEYATVVTPAQANRAADDEMEEDAPEFDLHDASEAATRLLARAGVAPEAGAAPAGQRQSRKRQVPERLRHGAASAAPSRPSRRSSRSSTAGAPRL